MDQGLVNSDGGNIIHIVGGSVISLITVGGVVTGFNEGWNFGIIARSASGEFEGSVISGWGRNRLFRPEFLFGHVIKCTLFWQNVRFCQKSVPKVT